MNTSSKHPLRALSLCFFLLMLLVLVLPAQAQRGAITIPRNLAQLVDQAETIVRGQVILAHVEPHPVLSHLHTVVVTFRVEEVLKGNPQRILTYRQLIWDIRDQYDAAGYSKGQRLLLLLNHPTRYGLTSPAGLEQGRFRLLKQEDGNDYAVNGLGNAGLFRNLAEQLEKRSIVLDPALARTVSISRPGPVPLEQLETLVRQIEGSKAE